VAIGQTRAKPLAGEHCVALDPEYCWRAALIAEGVSQTMAAKAYRLLRAILMTAALEDRLIPRNPCQIRGANKEYSEERPVLTVAQVLALAEVMPYRKYRALILITAFCSLRWGEVTALRRCDVAPDGSWVRVSSQFHRSRRAWPGPYATEVTSGRADGHGASGDPAGAGGAPAGLRRAAS
jgi:integrase